MKSYKGEGKGGNPGPYSETRIAFWLSIVPGICMRTSMSGILKTNDYTTRVDESRGPIPMPKEGNIAHNLKIFIYNGIISTQPLRKHSK